MFFLHIVWRTSRFVIVSSSYLQLFQNNFHAIKIIRWHKVWSVIKAVDLVYISRTFSASNRKKKKIGTFSLSSKNRRSYIKKACIFGWISRVVEIIKFIHKLFHSRNVETFSAHLFMPLVYSDVAKIFSHGYWRCLSVVSSTQTLADKINEFRDFSRRRFKYPRSFEGYGNICSVTSI